MGTNVTGNWKRWGKGGTTTKTKANYWRAAWHCRQRECRLSVLLEDRAISLWEPEPERSAWLDQITLVSSRYRRASKTLYYNSSNCAPEEGLQCSLHHPDSNTIAKRILIPHLYVLSKYPCNIDCDLRRQCQDVNKLEMQETNRIYLFVPRCWISPLILHLQLFKLPPNVLWPCCLQQ